MDVTGSAAPRLTDGHDQLHSISLILGQIINKAFSYQISAIEWRQFVGMVHAWLDEIPQHVKPFSRGRSVTLSTVGELPSFWFLQDFHGMLSITSFSATVGSPLLILVLASYLASARQYALVSLSILTVLAPPDQLSLLHSVANDVGIVGHETSKEELLDAYALEICGIAFTTNIPSVIVNSFGPIAYCKWPATKSISRPSFSI